MDLVVQKIEWASLKPFIEEFTNEYIKFKFPSSNVPVINEEVFDFLKDKFSSICWDRPGEWVTHNYYVDEYEPGPWVFITLEFKHRLKLRDYQEFIKLNKLD